MAWSDITATSGHDHRQLVAGRFRDVAHARAAIEALQSAGIDGADVALLSPFADPHPANAPADRHIARYLVRRILGGVLVGIACGAIVGALCGAVLLAVTTPTSALGELLALVVVGTISGASLGAYVGFERAGTLSDAWSTTFDALEPGAIWVGVTIHAAQDRVKACRVLDRQGSIETKEL